MSRRTITDEQRSQMVELRETKKYSIARIARILNVSPGAVGWELLRVGSDINERLPLRPPRVESKPIKRGEHVVRPFTQAEDAKLLELEAAGTSCNQIGFQLGRRHNSIIGRLRTLARRSAREELRSEVLHG